MDKLNGININLGRINNDLSRESQNQQAPEEQEAPPEVKAPEVQSISPDKIMEAMSRMGLNNLNMAVASGGVASKSIQDSVNQFTSNITPEMHNKLTQQVKQVIDQEFPNAASNPELVAEVVDNIIIGNLAA